MKKIRQGIFETNSSSTHSFSFGRTELLVEDGVLHYERLVPIGLGKSDEYLNNDWVCICKTYEEKFSMLIHAVFNSSTPPQIKLNLLNTLKDRCKYKLVYTTINSEPEMYDEVNGGIFDNCETEKRYYDVLNQYINYAEDDTIMFKEIYIYI